MGVRACRDPAERWPGAPAAPPDPAATEPAESTATEPAEPTATEPAERESVIQIPATPVAALTPEERKRLERDAHGLEHNHPKLAEDLLSERWRVVGRHAAIIQVRQSDPRHSRRSGRSRRQ